MIILDHINSRMLALAVGPGLDYSPIDVIVSLVNYFMQSRELRHRWENSWPYWTNVKGMCPYGYHIT